MKQYINEIVDLTGDSYINPVGAAWPDGSGTHQRLVSKITSIAIHHDAMDRPHDYDSVLRYRQEAAGHYNRLGPGLQYHYKIDNTGVIFAIRPLKTWLYAVGSAENTTSINICLDGNFEYQQPTREQYEALYQLIEHLCTQRPEFSATWPDVRPHADYSPTACCGANLRNRIYAIQDEATAREQLLNVGVYDWPEYQPQTAHVEAPQSAPAPAPVPEPTPAPVTPPAPSPAPTQPVTVTPTPTPVPVVVMPPTTTFEPAPTPEPPKESPLPSRDSATGRGLMTAVQAAIALAGAALIDPHLLQLLDTYAPNLKFYLPVAVGLVSFLNNFFRHNVEKY